jgi:uncharacterized protein (TIGR03083 family)
MATNASSKQLLESIADERLKLVALLETFTPQQWEHASLCDGWTNRHVVAHLTMGFLPMPQFMWRMIKARGDFNRAADAFAKEKALGGTAALVDTLRTNAAHPFKPPGMGYEAPLSDVMMHGIDIRRPLGIVRAPMDSAAESERWRVVLENTAQPKNQKFFRNDIGGVTLQATDLDWTHGNGPVVRGTSEELALLLGRRCKTDADYARLSGEGVALLKARTSSVR